MKVRIIVVQADDVSAADVQSFLSQAFDRPALVADVPTTPQLESAPPIPPDPEPREEESLAIPPRKTKRKFTAGRRLVCREKPGELFTIEQAAAMAKGIKPGSLYVALNKAAHAGKEYAVVGLMRLHFKWQPEDSHEARPMHSNAESQPLNPNAHVAR